MRIRRHRPDPELLALVDRAARGDQTITRADAETLNAAIHDHRFDPLQRMGIGFAVLAWQVADLERRVETLEGKA